MLKISREKIQWVIDDIAGQAWLAFKHSAEIIAGWVTFKGEEQVAVRHAAELQEFCNKMDARLS